ncbi:MAG: DUF21 domain-containing protein [Desulfobacteraceae bacterium]|nr:MAG: DUF21 domain-containing protein [Desulfobacteraceae bacterium]
MLMLILLIVLLGFSGFFSGSETALMAISRLRLRHLAETKPRRTGIVERLLIAGLALHYVTCRTDC